MSGIQPLLHIPRGRSARVAAINPSKRYTISRSVDGQTYSCSCPAWLFTKSTNTARTCKHLLAELGVSHEQARLASFPGATEQISKIVKSLEAADAKEKRKLVKRKLEEEGEGAVKKSKKQSSSGKTSSSSTKPRQTSASSFTSTSRTTPSSSSRPASSSDPLTPPSMPAPAEARKIATPPFKPSSSFAARALSISTAKKIPISTSSSNEPLAAAGPSSRPLNVPPKKKTSVKAAAPPVKRRPTKIQSSSEPDEHSSIVKLPSHPIPTVERKPIEKKLDEGSSDDEPLATKTVSKIAKAPSSDDLPIAIKVAPTVVKIKKGRTSNAQKRKTALKERLSATLHRLASSLPSHVRVPPSTTQASSSAALSTGTATPLPPPTSSIPASSTVPSPASTTTAAASSSSYPVHVPTNAAAKKKAADDEKAKRPGLKEKIEKLREQEEAQERRGKRPVWRARGTYIDVLREEKEGEGKSEFVRDESGYGYYHCITEEGHVFRVGGLNLVKLRRPPLPMSIVHYFFEEYDENGAPTDAIFSKFGKPDEVAQDAELGFAIDDEKGGDDGTA